VSSDTGSVPDRLRRAAAAAAVPATVVAAWHGQAPEPIAGQLWRASWGELNELVLVLAVAGDHLRTAPVTVDVDYADEDTVVLPADATPLSVELAVWLGLQRDLPFGVLDRYLGSIGERWRKAEDVERGLASGDPRRGPACLSAADPRAEYRARLDDTLDMLAAATWVPTGSGGLPQLLRAAGLDPQQLVTLLGMTPQQALAVLRGQAPLSSDQADRLVQVSGHGTDELLAANPPLPADLVARLDRPRRRAQVRELARRRQVPETAAWRAAAFGTWALAARQTGDKVDAAWDQRLDRYFQVVLDD
jgi:plasmid maintenance system antidote protein VapI